jgi:hypothetical protein
VANAGLIFLKVRKSPYKKLKASREARIKLKGLAEGQ